MANYAGGETFRGTLLGIPRSIRSDEWIVFTPFALSQARSGYTAISSLPRAMPTDVTMVYAQPAWALANIFRPFLWGFMLQDSEMELAFFWSARLMLLLLVSYEFGRCSPMMTAGSRPLADFSWALSPSFCGGLLSMAWPSSSSSDRAPFSSSPGIS